MLARGEAGPVTRGPGALATALAIAAMVVIGPAPALASSPAAAPAPGGDIDSQTVVFTADDGERLGGRLFRPADAPEGEKLPGLVLVHGSGTGLSWNVLKAEAEAFARQGIVVLAPDKRSKGYSDFERDFSQLADDAVAALGVLREQRDVGATGLWGLSEGGWVAPLAADRSADADFLITAGGPGVPPLRSQSWNAANKLDRAGVRGSLRHAYAYGFHGFLADIGMFPEARFDPVPALRGFGKPVLAIWGENDEQVPPTESAEVFHDSVEKGLTVRFVEGAGHSLHPETADGPDPDALVPGYAETVGEWVRAVAAGKPPADSADEPPRQPHRSLATPPSAWWLHLSAMAAILATCLGYAVTSLIRRRASANRHRSGGEDRRSSEGEDQHLGAEEAQRRGAKDDQLGSAGVDGRPAARSARSARAARVLAVSAALAVVLPSATFIALMISSNAMGVGTGPLILGRPIAWLAAQFAGIAAAVATAVLLTGWRTLPRPERFLALAGVLFIPCAAYWGVLLP